MEFKINNRSWVIEEVSEVFLKEILQNKILDDEKITMANGLTDFQKQIIYLNEDLHIDQKRQTLLHELMHCYIRTFIFWPQLDEASEETICDISANSHDIIHEITEKYFKK